MLSYIIAVKGFHWYHFHGFPSWWLMLAVSSASPWYYVIAWFFCSLWKIKEHYWGNVKNSFGVFCNHPFERQHLCSLLRVCYCFLLKDFNTVPCLVTEHAIHWQAMSQWTEAVSQSFRPSLIYILVQWLLGNEKQWKSWPPFPFLSLFHSLF